MKYKHKNVGGAAQLFYDDKGQGHSLLPNETVVLEKKYESAYITVEQISEKKTKYKGDDKE